MARRLVAIEPETGDILAYVSRPATTPTCSSTASTRKAGTS
jgi:cell division protein FtsI/penicillin-binding protein 2